MKIKVYEINTEETLQTFESHETEKAYEYARQMEEMGIEVKVKIPSINHTLADSLGMGSEDLENLTVAIDKEIDSHNSCCVENMPEQQNETTDQVN